MLVKNYMTRHPIMIGPEKPVYEAQKLMVENSIRHLPVVGDGKRILGLLTRHRLDVSPDKLGSLEVWEITRYLAQLTVKKIMIKGSELVTIDSEATLEKAATLMIRHKIGGLPVIEDDVVVGVITETDLLVELQELLGATEPGWRVTVRVPDRPGVFSNLSGAMAERGWGIMSWGSGRTPKAPESWDIVLKVRNCTEEELVSVLEDLDDLEVLDIRETIKSNP